MRICMAVRNAMVRDARVLREAQALAGAGHDLTIIAMSEPGLPDSEERDGFRIRRIDPVPSWIRRIARRPAIQPQTGPGGGGVTSTRRGRLVVVRDRLVTSRMTRAMARVPADVYHAHDLNTLESAVAAAHDHHALLVFDAHELYPDMTGLSAVERGRWRAIEGRLIGRADRVITVSDSLAAEFASRYGIAPPLVLLNVPVRPPAPPDPSSSPLAGFRRPGEMLVLYSGGLTVHRGLESLVDAAERGHGWRLVMMAWGRLESDLRARGPGVAFVPPVSPDQVVAAASAADVGVIPFLPIGLNNTLALPNKLFEYVQAGLAVAASDLVELRRFVDGERAGVIFTPGDAASIASTLDSLAANPARVAEMRRRSARSAERFDWTIEKEKLLGLYADLEVRTHQ